MSNTTKALWLGIVVVLGCTFAPLVKADSGVTMTRAQVVYTLPGFSQLELYHDAMIVCTEGSDTCQVVIDDVQAVPAWAMDLDVCLTRAVVWDGDLEEPATVLGCSPDARILDVDRSEVSL